MDANPKRLISIVLLGLMAYLWGMGWLVDASPHPDWVEWIFRPGMIAGWTAATGVALCLLWKPEWITTIIHKVRWKRWGRRLGIGAAALVALFFVTWSVATVWTSRTLGRVLAESAELGPLTWDEMQRPEPPPEENGIWELRHAAAILGYQISTARLTTSRFLMLNALSNKPTWTAEDLESMEKTLERGRPALILARQAADRSCRHMQLDNRGRNLYSMELSHLSAGKQISALLASAARVEAAHGRTDQALDDLLRVARIGRDFREEPVLVSALVGLAIHWIACQSVDQILADGAPVDPARLAALQETLRLDPDLYRQAMIHERAFGLYCFDHLSRTGSLGAIGDEVGLLGLPTPNLAWMIRPWVRFEEIGYLELMNESVRKAPHAGPDFGKIPRYYVMSNLLIPALQKIHGNIAKSRAQADATRWGLAVLEEKARTGRLPASLDEIPQAMLPDRPTDPFSGKSFIYKPDPDGKAFTLYSLGVNGKDDGGDFRLPPEAARYPALASLPDLGIRWKTPEP